MIPPQPRITLGIHDPGTLVRKKLGKNRSQAGRKHGFISAFESENGPVRFDFRVKNRGSVRFHLFPHTDIRRKFSPKHGIKDQCRCDTAVTNDGWRAAA